MRVEGKVKSSERGLHLKDLSERVLETKTLITLKNCMDVYFKELAPTSLQD